eukprot:2554093-Prymnesium_polylepis.1
MAGRWRGDGGTCGDRSVSFYPPTIRIPLRTLQPGGPFRTVTLSSSSSELLAWSTGYTRKSQPPRTLYSFRQCNSVPARLMDSARPNPVLCQLTSPYKGSRRSPLPSST